MTGSAAPATPPTVAGVTAADTRPAPAERDAPDAPADGAPARHPRTARAPATRDQVDAYRFGQRRLEAALIRADPVPLHEQLRSQRRAAFGGILLGLLALGGAGVLAALSPATDWTREPLVVGDRSGTVYAVTPEPRRLVPVPNLVAGRLVLAALGEPAGGAVPATVSDDALARAPRTPPAAVPGAVGVRPDGPAVPADWAVCDTGGPDGAAPATTSVLAGALGPAPGPAPGLLVAGIGGSTYVVLDGARHRIDPADRPAMSALGVLGVPVRRLSDGLLSAIPEAAPLRTPRIAADVTVPGLGRAGDVVVSNPLGAEPSYFVVLGAAPGHPAGLAPVPVTLADALLAAGGGGRPATLAQGRVAQDTLTGALDVGGWPAARIAGADPATIPTVCWTWRDGRTGVVASDRVPLAPGAVPVDLAAADRAGPRLDTVVLPAGGPGPLESRGSTGGGTRWLLSSSGVLHGVADDRTAAALGITAAGRAPEEAVRLLPRGGALDLAAVRDVTDVAPG